MLTMSQKLSDKLGKANPSERQAVTYTERLVEVTITSPVAATVKAQLTHIMKAVDAAAARGERSCVIPKMDTRGGERALDMHPKTKEALAGAGMRIRLGDGAAFGVLPVISW